MAEVDLSKAALDSDSDDYGECVDVAFVVLRSLSLEAQIRLYLTA
jgi:hypothetical protein